MPVANVRFLIDHQIVHNAAEPFANKSDRRYTRCCLLVPGVPSPEREELTRESTESIANVSLTSHDGRMVRWLAGPGLLRRNEGLGAQIWQTLMERIRSA